MFRKIENVSFLLESTMTTNVIRKEKYLLNLLLDSILLAFVMWGGNMQPLIGESIYVVELNPRT